MDPAPFMEVVCPCGQRFIVHKAAVGQKVRCTSCWREFPIVPPVPELQPSPDSPPTASEPSPPAEPLLASPKPVSKFRAWFDRHDPDNILRLAAAAILGFLFVILLVHLLRSPLISGHRDRPPITLTLPLSGYVPPVPIATPAPGAAAVPGAATATSAPAELPASPSSSSAPSRLPPPLARPSSFTLIQMGKGSKP